jgi:hypothetical protein
MSTMRVMAAILDSICIDASSTMLVAPSTTRCGRKAAHRHPPPSSPKSGLRLHVVSAGPPWSTPNSYTKSSWSGVSWQGKWWFRHRSKRRTMRGGGGSKIVGGKDVK